MHVVSWSAMRRSGRGAPSSGRPTPTSCAGADPGPATNGTSMRCSSRINGTIHYLWRAVDQHGNVLDVLVQSRRNAVAAKQFFRKLLKGLRYVPRVLVTDKLAQLSGRAPRADAVGGASAVEVSEHSY